MNLRASISRRVPGKGGYARNVLVLLTGTTIAQAIPIAFSPVLTRLYGPRDFGVLAIFVAVTTVLGAIATGRYEMAIMIADDESDALNVASLCVVIALTLATALLLVVALWGADMATLLGSSDLHKWLFVAPPTIFLLGLFNALNYYNARHKNYGDIARATAGKSVATVAVQIGSGAAGAGAGGLIWGQLAAGLASNGRLLKSSRRLAVGIEPSRREMWRLARRFRRFPTLSMPAILANNLSVQLTNVLISGFFSVMTLGQYSLVQRALGLPSSLIGQSVGQVFFQRASEERRRTGRAVQIFDATSLRMAMLGVPAFVAIFFSAPALFAFVFGDPWRDAGEYARLLAPLFCIRFVVVAVSTTTKCSNAKGSLSSGKSAY